MPLDVHELIEKLQEIERKFGPHQPVRVCTSDGAFNTHDANTVTFEGNHVLIEGR